MGDAGDVQAGQVLESYLGVFTERYLRAKHQQPVDEASSVHQRLRELTGRPRQTRRVRRRAGISIPLKAISEQRQSGQGLMRAWGVPDRVGDERR